MTINLSPCEIELLLSALDALRRSQFSASALSEIENIEGQFLKALSVLPFEAVALAQDTVDRLLSSDADS